MGRRKAPRTSSGPPTSKKARTSSDPAKGRAVKKTPQEKVPRGDTDYQQEQLQQEEASDISASEMSSMEEDGEVPLIRGSGPQSRRITKPARYRNKSRSDFVFPIAKRESADYT